MYDMDRHKNIVVVIFHYLFSLLLQVPYRSLSPESLKKYERERKSKRRSQSLSEDKARKGRPSSKLTDSEKKLANRERVRMCRKRKKNLISGKNQ